MKDVVIYPGNFGTFEQGQKRVGLHLNRFVRDVLRQNGYPTKSCDSACLEPNICDLLTDCPGGGSNDWDDLINIPDTIEDIVGAAFAKGDMLYYDGSNLTRLPIGTAGQVLTVVAGDPVWATGGAGASAYLGLTDTPSVFVARDLVPTINPTLNALEHVGTNKLKSDAGTYLSIFTLPSVITGGSGVAGNSTIIGNKVFSNYQFTPTLDAGGSYPATVSTAWSLDNTGKVYPASNAFFQYQILVNGVRVPYSITAGGVNSETISFSIPSSSATVIIKALVTADI